MKRSMCLTAFLAVANVAHAGGFSSAVEQPEDDKRGAVLCHWSITVSLQAIGETCYKGRDEGNIAALDQAIGKMEAFILRNSDISASALESDRATLRARTIKDLKVDQNGECIAGQSALAHYPKPDRSANDRIKKWVTDLLAVERPPVWEPCF
jgi:hypothetical protein